MDTTEHAHTCILCIHINIYNSNPKGRNRFDMFQNIKRAGGRNGERWECRDRQVSDLEWIC